MYRLSKGTGQACDFAGGSDGGNERLADLFLQLPLRDAVLLSGVLARDRSQVTSSKVRLLPPPSMPGLAIVPVDDGDASCIPFDDQKDAKSLRTVRLLSPGPLRPVTAVGKALKNFWNHAPQDVAALCKYEQMRAACGGSQSLEEQAETLILTAYLRFCCETSVPPRPCADNEEDYDLYISVFQDAPMKALHHTCSADFCLIAEAHVLGLASNANFPRLSQKDARTMYSSALRFGYAVRQAEIRYKADAAAGTIVPLALEAEMARKELEQSWARPAVQGKNQSGGHAEDDGTETRDSDAAAARKSLQEVLCRLTRIGEAKPALATYLGWLGKFDPEALSMLSTPSPVIGVAMQSQVDAVWGKASKAEAVEPTVATTPSDMLEAIVFGAWLHDCDAEAREIRERTEASEEGACTS